MASIDRVTEGDVRIACSYTLIQDLRERGESMGIRIGAQNVSQYYEGAYTGEVSMTQLKDVGAEFVLLGHSERRHQFHETVDVVTAKIERAVVESMPFVLCIGETQDERRQRLEESVWEQQLTSLESLTLDQLEGVMIAYEPVWAIGTGERAQLHAIESAHRSIRGMIKTMFAGDVRIPILYGGSVSEENCDELLSSEEIDGVLVGSKSLDPGVFGSIVTLL